MSEWSCIIKLQVTSFSKYLLQLRWSRTPGVIVCNTLFFQVSVTVTHHLAPYLVTSVCASSLLHRIWFENVNVSSNGTEFTPKYEEVRVKFNIVTDKRPHKFKAIIYTESYCKINVFIKTQYTTNKRKRCEKN